MLKLESGEVLIESAAIDVVPPIGGLRFRLRTDRLDAADSDGARRRSAGEEVLTVLDAHLAGQAFFLGDHYSIPGIAMFSYLHVADEAGYDLAGPPTLAAWLTRVTEQPGFVDDLEPYPPNAQRGAGESIYG